MEDYKNCLELTKLENEINYLEKNKVNAESLGESQNQFIKNNKSI